MIEKTEIILAPGRLNGEMVGIVGLHNHPAGFPAPARPARHLGQKLKGALDTLETNLSTLTDAVDADVVHCHTWYPGILPASER